MESVRKQPTFIILSLILWPHEYFLRNKYVRKNIASPVGLKNWEHYDHLKDWVIVLCSWMRFTRLEMYVGNLSEWPDEMLKYKLLGIIWIISLTS